MKRIINKKKVRELLDKNNKSQKSLAVFIGYSETNLSESLKEENKRTIPMGYVFEIAKFFKVTPFSITESVTKCKK